MDTSANFNWKNSQVQALGLLRDIVRHLGLRYWGFVLLFLGLGLTSLLPPALFRFFTEQATSLGPNSISGFLKEIAIFGLIVTLTLFFTSILSTLAHEWLRLRLESYLRKKTILRLHHIPLSDIDQAQRGDWFSRMTGDLSEVESFVSESLPSQIQSLAILIGSGILFFLHSSWLAFVPLIAALIIAVLNIYVQKRVAPQLAELRKLHGGIFHLLIESLEGIRTIRSHGAEPFIERRFDSQTLEIQQKTLGVARTLGRLIGTNEGLSQILVTLCLTAVGWRLAQGSLTLEAALFYPFYVGMFYGSAQSLTNATYQWNRFFTEGSRLGEILTGENELLVSVSVPEVHLRSTALLRGQDLLVGHGLYSVTPPLNFEMKRCSIWLITGASGCGKSTLLESLAGLRTPVGGKLSVVDVGGRVLWQSRSPHTRVPREYCAYVEQRPYIFEGTLRDNLTFGNHQRLSDTRLWQGIESGGLYSFAQSVGGLDHLLRDRGTNLSEGERYRIALTRALLLNRPFLLIDEPFAALDQANITTILHTFERERSQRGIAIVSHFTHPAMTYDEHLDLEMLRDKKERIAGLSP